MKTRAAVLYEIGKPLKVDELSVPKLRTGQVLVKMAYSGVCHSQLMEARGKRGADRYLPHLLGHEGSGIVLQVGDEVNKIKQGDHVVLSWIKGDGHETGGTQYKKGDLVVNAGGVTTFNELAVVSENRCVRIPESFPLDVAALFGCAVMTGAGMVFNDIQPDCGSNILIWGVGGIGLNALIAAKISNCSPIIALDTQEENLDIAKNLGATHCINIGRDDPYERIYEIVGKQGVDYAVEAAGKTSTIEGAFRVTKKNGGVCVFAGHPPQGEKICIDPHDLISGKQIRGSWGGGAVPDRDIPRLIELYRSGKLPLGNLIVRIYTLSQINFALNDLESGAIGRSLVRF